MMLGLLLSLAYVVTLVFAEAKMHQVFPEFVKPSRRLSFTNYRTLYMLVYYQWYAIWPVYHDLVLLGRMTPTLVLNCKVKRIMGKDELEEIHFCFRKNDRLRTNQSGNFSCTVLNNSKKAHTSAGRKMSFNPQTGGILRMSGSMDDDLATEFYCAVKNRRGTLFSNIIRILDYRSKFKEAKEYEIHPTFSLNGPSIYDCPIPNLPSNVSLKYAWYTCQRQPRVGSPCAASLRQDLKYSAEWPIQVLRNGSLYFPFVPEIKKASLEGKFLLCFVATERNGFYGRPLRLETSSKRQSKTLRITYPSTSKGVQTTLLNSTTITAFYQCNFEIGAGKVTIGWSRTNCIDGRKLALNPGDNPEYKVKVNENELSLNGPFSAKTAGCYECSIKWDPENGAASMTRHSWFNVSVYNYPNLDYKLYPKKFIFNKGNGHFKCEFSRPSTIPSIRVNGIPIGFASEMKIKAEIKAINKKFEKVMRPLNISVQLSKSSMGSMSILYTAVDMRLKTQEDERDSSHLVECSGYNEYALVRRTVIMRVIPNMDVTTSMTNITENSTQTEPTGKQLECMFLNGDSFASEFTFEKYWLVERKRISKNTDLIKWEKDDNSLTLYRSNETGKLPDDAHCVIALKYTPKRGKVRVIYEYNRKFQINPVQKYNNEGDGDEEESKSSKSSSSYMVFLALFIMIGLNIFIALTNHCITNALNHHQHSQNMRRMARTYNILEGEKSSIKT